jgi:hypothetical protein
VDVTREHVERILHMTSLTADQQAEVLALDYPADIEDVMNVMGRFGITRDSLVSSLGGSP